MEKYEIKTCGTCICFMKSSCVYPTSEADWISCAKYQEAYYTLSAISQTTEISKPIRVAMNEKQIESYDTYDYINVYQINDDVFVAETIENAIELYKESRVAEYERKTIRKVELLNYNAKIKKQTK